MSEQSSTPGRRGQRRLERRPSQPADDDRESRNKLRLAVQELQLHQLELELQNRELEEARRLLEDSRVALVASEQRYRGLFEQSPAGRMRLDANGLILEANQTAADLLGSENWRLTGRKLSDFVAPGDQDAYYLHRHATRRGEHPGPIRLGLRTVHGEMREIELASRPSEDGAGEISVAILDVTARELAQAEHHESLRQRRLVADALPVGVSYVDADGRIAFCNRAFERLLGSLADQIEGRSIFEVLDPDTYAGVRDHVRTTLSGEPSRFEGELGFASGSHFVSALFAPYRSPSGLVRGFWMLVDDRTELEEARRGLRRAAAQAALAEERERRALAADLHDDVGQLLSLASIKLRELQERLGETPSAGPLRMVAELTRQARESIASLSFELSPPLLYDLGFVAAAEWLAESLRGRYGLKTSIETRGEVPELDEPARVTLFRALRELLINAAKHAGTNRAAVSIERCADGVCVAVADQGVGFDPSTRASGFGLRSILDRIESLGGRVVVESAPREGTRVSVTMPAGQRSPA